MEMNTLSHGITFVESDVLLQDISNQHAGSTDYSDHCCIKCNTKTSEKEKSKHSHGYWELVRIEKEKKVIHYVQSAYKKRCCGNGLRKKDSFPSMENV